MTNNLDGNEPCYFCKEKRWYAFRILNEWLYLCKSCYEVITK